MIDVQSAIDNYIKENREEKERNSFYITDLARCPSGVFLERSGVEPTEGFSERQFRVFEAGNVFEEFALKALRDGEGYEIKEQGSIVIDGFRGRYDGLIIQDNHAHVLEFKSMHSRGFHWMNKSGEDAKEHHIEQMMCYLHGLKDEYETVVGSVIYISKDDMCIKQADFAYDEDMMKDLLMRIEILNQAWKAGAIPTPAKAVVFDEARGKYTVNWKAKYCPYHDQCTGDPDWLGKAEAEVRKLNKNL